MTYLYSGKKISYLTGQHIFVTAQFFRNDCDFPSGSRISYKEKSMLTYLKDFEACKNKIAFLLVI